MNEENLNILNVAPEEKKKNNFLKPLRNLLKNLMFPKKETLEESVNDLIEEHDKDGERISEEEKELIHNVFSYRDLKAEDIMIPNADITAIPLSIDLDELKQIIIETRHTRIPVYKETLDNIVGFINVKDLIPVICGLEKFNLERIVREVLVISPSMRLVNLLGKMRESRIHIALVVDEYGETDGLITIENLVEEIIGDLEDEYDSTPEDEVIQKGENCFEVSARLPIEILEKRFNFKIINEQKDDFDTVGGLILAIAGCVPKKGEKVIHSDIEFEILDSDPRRIKRVLLKK